MLSCEYVHMRITYTYLAHFLKPLSGRLHQVPKLPIILTINPNPPCQLPLCEETGEPGQNPRQSVLLPKCD